MTISANRQAAHAEHLLNVHLNITPVSPELFRMVLADCISAYVSSQSARASRRLHVAIDLISDLV